MMLDVRLNRFGKAESIDFLVTSLHIPPEGFPIVLDEQSSEVVKVKVLHPEADVVRKILVPGIAWF
jgi:hypothetical protein